MSKHDRKIKNIFQFINPMGKEVTFWENVLYYIGMTNTDARSYTSDQQKMLRGNSGNSQVWQEIESEYDLCGQ